jgi:hypothetical protein
VRRTLMKCTSPVLLLASVLLAHAQDVPVLDIEPVCRGIAQQAATAGERGGPDLGLAQCIKSEQATREQLAREWSTFAAADKPVVSGKKSWVRCQATPTCTCLEMARDARKMNTN